MWWMCSGFPICVSQTFSNNSRAFSKSQNLLNRRQYNHFQNSAKKIFFLNKIKCFSPFLLMFQKRSAKAEGHLWSLKKKKSISTVSSSCSVSRQHSRSRNDVSFTSRVELIVALGQHPSPIQQYLNNTQDVHFGVDLKSCRLYLLTNWLGQLFAQSIYSSTFTPFIGVLLAASETGLLDRDWPANFTSTCH